MNPDPRAAQANSAGHAAMKAGDHAAAERHFAQAVTLAPDALPLRLNHAIALNRLDRHREALDTLAPVEAQGRSDAAYCSTAGFAQRAVGNLAAAAQWYDRALALEPSRPRALQGRATVALERGEPDAVARFDRALAQNGSDPWQWHGKAQALEVAGDTEGARRIAQQLVDQAPQWTEGLKLLAQLRLGAGERDWASHYRSAAERVPSDPTIPAEHAAQLAGLDENAEAAAVMESARRRFPGIARFTLLHAIYASAAGERDTAEALFAATTFDTAERWLYEARHALASGQVERSDAALDKCFAHDGGSVAAWALRDFLWRLNGDARAQWLHEQAGLVQMRELRDADKVLPPVRELLDRLHDNSAMPLGQSLRGGTQTRGLLFQRTEPALAALREAVLATLDDYRAELPPEDADHPLLRHRNAEWRIAGSWSVRLGSGGHHHAAHIHPLGLLSSALYCTLPETPGEDDDPQSGWLELGRPPQSLNVDLPPVRAIEPREGHLALFPSTLYHGTRPFATGRRMTVAFDVVTAQDTP